MRMSPTRIIISIAILTCSAVCSITPSLAQDPSIIDFETPATATTQTVPEQTPQTSTPQQAADNIVLPRLIIPIPTIPSFSQVTVQTSDEGRQYLDIPWIAQYLSGLYVYLLSISGVIAGIIIMYAGFKWMTAGGNAAAISDAKEKISNALIGISLLVSAYLILFIINPELIANKALRVSFVERIELTTDGLEDESSANTLPLPAAVDTDFVKLNIDNITGDVTIAQSLVAPLEQVALELKKKNISIAATSGLRDVNKQVQLAKDNCVEPYNTDGTKNRCTPKTGKVITCVPGTTKNSDGSITYNTYTCPHTSGKAIDLWARGKGCPLEGSQKTCMKDIAACKQDRCQAALIEEMKKQGFCVLDTEPWHFENPKMSSKCN